MSTDPIRHRWRDGDAEGAPLESLAGDLFRAVPPTRARSPQASARLFAQLRDRKRSWSGALWHVFGLRPLALALSLMVTLNLALAVTMPPVNRWWSDVLSVEVPQIGIVHRARSGAARSTQAAPVVAAPLPAAQLAPSLEAPSSPVAPPSAIAAAALDERSLEGSAPRHLAGHSNTPLASLGSKPRGERAPPAPTVALPAARNELAGESELLSQALGALSAGHPNQALAAVAAYRGQFPRGKLAYETTLAEVKAQLVSGHDDLALEAIERAMATPGFRTLPRSSEMMLLRAELQARARDCSQALPTFDRLATAEDLDGPLTERALYGRASCLASQGDRAASRQALEGYLQRFPAGRFASAARTALGTAE